jgi:hypothetical protein
VRPAAARALQLWLLTRARPQEVDEVESAPPPEQEEAAA